VQHGLEASFPFLDRELVAFLLAIPGEVQNWQGVPRAILREGLRGVLPEGVGRRTSKGDYTHWENAGMKQGYDEVVRRLNREAHAVRRGYVDGDAVRPGDGFGCFPGPGKRARVDGFQGVSGESPGDGCGLGPPLPGEPGVDAPLVPALLIPVGLPVTEDNESERHRDNNL